MLTNYNYLIPEERKPWKSAYEIEIAALKHEELRLMTLPEDTAWVKSMALEAAERRTKFLSFMKSPLHMLTGLFG